jgi:hypothetical protein
MESTTQQPIIEEKVFTFDLSSIGCVRESPPSLNKVVFISAPNPDPYMPSVVVLNENTSRK